MKREAEGILVLDADGTMKFASGLGHDALIAGHLVRLWQDRMRTPLKRVSAMTDLEHPMTIAAIPSRDAVCFLIFALQEANELSEFLATVDSAEDILRHFITDPYKAMVVVDTAGKITYMSPVHERFFGLKRGEALGRHVTTVIENTKLQEVAVTGKGQVGQLQEMNGIKRVVSRLPVLDRNQRVVAAIGQVMFKGPEAMQAVTTELAQVRQELDFYRRELSGIGNRTYGLDQIVGSSDAVRRLKEDILRVAPLDVPVLLAGESGSGKELVAHAIHMLSPRSDKPLVLVNSAAMPPNLVESELFGYEPGAFTGADRKGRKGKFEAADTGTLFLDEIGDMPVDMQVKLLRVLQDGQFERIGGERARHSDFRLISASNRDFSAMIAKSSFRLDLFYRISAVTLRLPALRDRLEDIPELADKFLEAFGTRHGAPKKAISDSAIRFLQSCAWPGNVRQLQHAIERAAIFCDGPILSIADFGNLESADSVLAMGSVSSLPRNGENANPDMRKAMERVESEMILEAMRRTGGNKKRVAEELGISRSYLYKRLRLMEDALTSELATR
ncbi:MULTISPECIES: sigma-54 interaction domain-containing protein [Cupriavidus]|uniref:Sigma 54-interacting transcriptional regulator n=2 Tax=Pseudomonadota TaxID=1224 RepID=A0A643G4B7_9BURK|nr:MULTISPECIES: sigma 54-interacting transcriptional regulator [Cupriavidus]KUE88056.1 Fis family transcriptional regulator [Cupriavidus necator]NOV23470.1 PAS domain S-box protein [Cupriavidus necator]QOT81555.1 sigma 54-interacting transcriptional regulator [Cupriavidus basilensis]BDB30252.1 sigma 54-interacting transcriptional regulator [Cupriavidus sp. P-10]